MPHRYRAVAGVVTVLLILGLAPERGVAQTTDTPRTMWGDPDLGGVWDFRSATPMTRPEEFKDKAVLTEEEAAAFSLQQANFQETIDNGEVVPGNAIHTRVFLDFGTDTVDDRRSSLIIDPLNGQHPPRVEGAAERSAAIAGSWGTHRFDSWEDLNLMDRCLGTVGFPIVPGAYNNNIQIFSDARPHRHPG